MEEIHRRRTHARRQAGMTLNAVRAGLEHKPRDPFAVNRAAALEELTLVWGAVFDVGYANYWWYAYRPGSDDEPLTAETPDDLAVAMRKAWNGGAW